VLFLDARRGGLVRYKASLRITPREGAPWTLAADTAGATAHEFSPKR